jgi:chemotaxis protein methyltransferase CheR
MNPDTFAKFQNLLTRESGWHVSADDAAGFEKKLMPRMNACGAKTFEGYLDYLFSQSTGKKELAALIDSITVGETYFFRNKPQFDILGEFVIPKLVETKGDRNIRIWSAGCSSGEEPYSIAMLLRETVPSIDEWNVSILGTDINRRVLEIAKEGVYKKKAIRFIPTQYLSQYFTEEEKCYRLNDTIKNMVSFQYHNLAKDTSCLPGMIDLDIIFCRNVLIYFDDDTLRRAVSRFSDCLLPDGFLFMGHSETLWGVKSPFRVLEFPNTFIYQKGEGERGEETPLIPLPAVVPEISPHVKPSTIQTEANVKDGFAAFARKEYDKAGRIFDQYLNGHPDDVDVLMARGTILSNNGDYEGALTYFTKVVQVDNLYAPAYYFIGVLNAKTRRYDEAVEGFRKTLYVDPELAVCYFHLGNLYNFLKRRKKAEKEYQNCLKLLSEKDADEAVALSEGLTVEVLRQAVFRALESV